MEQGYLRELKVLWDQIARPEEYPFSLPVFRHLQTLEFDPKVTFIIGENGTGKSTLLEAIAVAWGFNPEGGSLNFNFSTRASHSGMYDFIRLIRGVRRPKDGFFFRAESFFNVATNIESLDDFGIGPPIINAYGGKSLHEQSHGESFFATFKNRFRGKGLYILDEPEAALSPTRQMALLALIHDLVRRDSQLIIATHSPIIMAYPDAKILELAEKGFTVVAYEQTEHYTVMREFINNPQKMLSILLDS